MRINGSILAIASLHDDRRPPMRESGASRGRRGFGRARVGSTLCATQLRWSCDSF